MLKKILSTLCVVILLFSLIPANAFAATVINQDVSIVAPIYSRMETLAEATAVNTQLTASSSSATLCDDAAEGNFSLKVTAADIASSNSIQYTLVSSDTFSTSSYSSINIWVKPGVGASWVSFYTNGAMITSDKDGDGNFTVGSDLQSGKWTKLTLDLLKTSPSITTGDDLVVKSNDSSVWYFDGITSQGTGVTTVDLTKMVSINSLITNGNFANGTTGWTSATGASTNASVSNNILTWTPTSLYDGWYQNITYPDNHVIYASMWLKSPLSNAANLQIWGGSPVAWVTQDNVWQQLSLRFNQSVNLKRLAFLNSSYNNAQPMSAKQVFAVDLTAAFGAGNEPTQSWCDANLSYNSTTGNVTINNGSLQFSKTSDGTAYNVTPTTLVSGRNTGTEKISKTQSDFASGTCVNMIAGSGGGLSFSGSSLTGGSAISGGDYYYHDNYFGWTFSYPASGAFDSDQNTMWESSQSGSSVIGAAYIGYNFGSAKAINGVSILCPDSINIVNSAYLQYYNSSTSQWVTWKTLNLTRSTSSQYFWFESSLSAAQWRLLAASTNGSGNFCVFDLKFLNSQWSYTSPSIDISTTNAISKGTITISSSECSNAIISTQLSLDGGTTWSTFVALNSNGSINGIDSNTNLSNAKLKYLISGTKAVTEYAPTINSVDLNLIGNEQATGALSGKVTAIKIDSCIMDVSGNSVTAKDISLLINRLGISSTMLALSGDGKLLYYRGNDGNLYIINIKTGTTSLFSNLATLGLSSISSFKVNYDGTVLCIYGMDSSVTSSYDLVKYSTKDTTARTTIVSSNNNGIFYDIQNNGGIVYYYIASSVGYLNYCYPSGTVKTILSGSSYTNILGVAIAKASGDVFYINSSALYSYSAVSSYSTLSGSFSNVTSILCASNDGSEVYVNYNGTYCSYNIKSGVIRPLTSGISSMIPLDNGRFFANGQYIYNPSTSEKVDITPPNAASLLAVDNAGKTLIYQSTDYNINVKNLNSADSVNKYLLSFDGKNTWYSYVNGTWTKVSSDKTPADSVFAQYGMTSDKVNALSKSDFAKLYSNGTEIYSVDVAVYFNSVNSNYSPSINSIKIITDASSYGDSASDITNPLFTAKKTDFAGSGWRTINKIYPVEIAPSKADMIYFFYANGKYMYYDGTAWHTEATNEISNMISDVGTNWVNLKLIGMTADTMRAIPKDVLTSQFAGIDFSVVYCMRVYDTSTKGYLSNITADYNAKLFSSNTLTLSITYVNGSTQQISGLTSTQIQDFMDWLTTHTSKSPALFSFTVGSMYYYIIYNSITNVSVTAS